MTTLKVMSFLTILVFFIMLRVNHIYRQFPIPAIVPFNGYYAQGVLGAV